MSGLIDIIEITMQIRKLLDNIIKYAYEYN